MKTFDEIQDYEDTYYFVNRFEAKIVDNEMFVKHTKKNFTHESRCGFDCLVYTERQDHELEKVYLFIDELEDSDMMWIEKLREELKPLHCRIMVVKGGRYNAY